jgi:hypothetical protein
LKTSPTDCPKGPFWRGYSPARNQSGAGAKRNFRPFFLARATAKPQKNQKKKNQKKKNLGERNGRKSEEEATAQRRRTKTVRLFSNSETAKKLPLKYASNRAANVRGAETQREE